MKRLRVIIILPGFIFLACLAFAFTGPKEPSYQGKTLTEWLLVHGRNKDKNDYTTSRNSIQTIGTNGLPTLLRLMRATDTPVIGKAIVQVNRLKIGHLYIRTAEDKHVLAAVGFIILGGESAPAIPELLKLTRHSDFDVREMSEGCLGSLIEDHQEFRSSFFGALTNSDLNVRALAGGFLQTKFPKYAERLGLNIPTSH